MRVNKFKDQSITLTDGSVITAVRGGNFITFSGSRTGEHRLHVMSSPARVQAHWFGYVQAALDAQAKPAFYFASERDCGRLPQVDRTQPRGRS